MPFAQRLRRRPRIGLALGAGGARGLAHVGVLKTLEAHNIPIDLIAGTSIGALVGAAYALDPRAALLEEKISAFLRSSSFRESGLDLFKKRQAAENFFGQVATYVRERVVINLAHSRPSLVGGWRITKAVDFILANKNYEDLKLPFVCVAADLTTGEEIVFREGSLREAVQASMSIPGFLPPVLCHGYQLVDGAVVAPVPVVACRAMGADLVIAVDVGQHLDGFIECENVIDIIFRASTITGRRFNHMLLELADLVVRPNVGNAHWSEFRKAQDLIAEGERAASTLVEEIKRRIDRRGSWWRRLVPGNEFPG